MVSDLEKSEITCLAANDWKSFIQSRSWEMKKGIKKEEKKENTMIWQSQLINIKTKNNKAHSTIQHMFTTTWAMLFFLNK